MAAPSPWPLIHQEREALADDLGTLSGEQWSVPSLCPGWTARDVLGHLIAITKTTQGSFLTNLARAGFRFNTMTATLVSRESTPEPAAGLTEFRRHLTDTTRPHGPAEAMLGEIVVPLLLAMTGRSAALADLSGDGLTTLRSRA